MIILYILNYTVLPGSLMRGAVTDEDSDTNDNRRDDDINDCHKDRQAVLDEQVLYIYCTSHSFFFD